MRPTNGCRILRLFAVFCIAFCATEAAAEGGHSLSYRNVVVLQGNPILLRDLVSLDYRYRLYESSSPHLRNNYLGFALRPVLSPGFARIGGAVEVAPASVVRLGLGWEQITFFGTFDQLQSFAAVDADYSDAELGTRGDADENYAATGTDVAVSALLQNRFGPVIVRDLFELHRVSYDLQTGDDFFYEPVLDMLLPEKGWAFSNDLDVLYISPLGLIAGVRYTLVKAFYDASDPNGPSHRFGPSLSYVVFQNPGAAFDSATIFVLLNWWLKHRFRTGEDVSGGVPFLSVGFSFTGALL